MHPIIIAIFSVALAGAYEPDNASGANKPKEELSDIQDLLFLGDRGPIKIRLHLRVDGLPFATAWDDYMQALFNYADRDGNGVLDEKEAKLIPSSSFLAALMAGGFSLQTTDVVAPFKELDRDGDGKLTLAEMKAYFRKTGQGPFQLHISPGEGTSQALTDALFKALDQNKDGKLSKEEIGKAEQALLTLDINDEEVITPDRLIPPAALFGQAPPAPATNVKPAKSRVTDFVVLSADESSANHVQLMLARYAKGKDKTVTRSEMGFDKALFDQLDANKDGKLDGAELAKWFAEPPQLELCIQLGEMKGDPRDTKIAGGRLSLCSPGKQTFPPGIEVGKTADGSMTLKLANALIEMQSEDVPATKFSAVRRFHLQQFRGVRGDEKSVKAELAKNNTFLAGLFPLADRDGDGQLTESELEAFFDVHSKGALCFTTLSLGDHGYGLFELLDTNHDSRLSLREMKAAWKVLEPWDANQDGCISQNELPRQFQITLSQGPKLGSARFAIVGAPRSLVDSIPAHGKKGPVWFRKMDRNGDGDVSRREFLGSDEDFRRIDTDGDGLISVEEAEKAEALFRKKSDQKK